MFRFFLEIMIIKLSLNQEFWIGVSPIGKIASAIWLFFLWKYLFSLFTSYYLKLLSSP